MNGNRTREEQGATDLMTKADRHKARTLAPAGRSLVGIGLALTLVHCAPPPCDPPQALPPGSKPAASPLMAVAEHDNRFVFYPAAALKVSPRVPSAPLVLSNDFQATPWARRPARRHLS